MSLVYIEGDGYPPRIHNREFVFVQQGEIFPLNESGNYYENAEKALREFSQRPNFRENFRVRAAVTRALRNVPTPGSKEMLRELSRDRHSLVRWSACYALIPFRERDTLNDFNRLSRDPVIEVRAAAARSAIFFYNRYGFDDEVYDQMSAEKPDIEFDEEAFFRDPLPEQGEIPAYSSEIDQKYREAKESLLDDVLSISEGVIERERIHPIFMGGRQRSLVSKVNSAVHDLLCTNYESTLRERYRALCDRTATMINGQPLEHRGSVSM